MGVLWEHRRMSQPGVVQSVAGAGQTFAQNRPLLRRVLAAAVVAAWVVLRAAVT
jgi:hypothetical protein